MLQWMGGSRRKVITTRKSTYNRQKQYFEQKKRQQRAPGLESYSDGKNKRVHYDEGPRSLDILSLTNLSTGDSYSTDADVSKCLPSLPSNKTFPRYGVHLEEGKRSSNSQHERHSQKKRLSLPISPENNLSSRNCSLKIEDRSEEWKIQASSNDLSIFDLLNDDGSHDNSEGRSAHESHVAFSVEGLGKIGTETPDHSPRQTVRVSFVDLCLPRESSRRMKSSDEVKFISDELGFELNPNMQDIGISVGGSPSKLLCSFGLKKHLGNSQRLNFGDIELDARINTTNKFSTEKEDIFKPAVHRQERTRNDRFGMLDDKLLGKGKYDACCQSSDMEGNDAQAFSQVKHSGTNYCFEEFGSQDRRPYDSYSNYPTLERDSHLMSSNRQRSPVTSWASHVENLTNPPDWSFSETDDAVDNMSLLSDESSSSTAVRHGRTNNSCLNPWKIKGSQFIHQNKLQRWSEKKYDTKNLAAHKIMFDDLNEVLQEKNLARAGSHMSLPNQWRSRAYECLEKPSVIKGISKTCSWSLFEEEYSSVDVNLTPSPLPRRYAGSFDYENHFDIFQDSAANPGKDLSNGRFKCHDPVSHDLYDKLSVENHPIKEEKSNPLSEFSNPTYFSFGIKDQSPFSSCSEECQRDDFLDISRQHKVGRDNNVESGILPTSCRETHTDAHHKSCVEENGSSLKIMTTSDVADNSSKHEEVRNEMAELSENQKTGSSSQVVETTIASEEVTANPECFISTKLERFYGRAPVQLQVGNKESGKEEPEHERINAESKGNSTADSSYQVMLESYVLQLLCVQKVLMDSSIQDGVKKV